MRKVTDFIVNKRFFILILFIIFSIISVILSQKIVINYDMSKYLPNTSETRIGMDIMEKEFSGTETSSFNLMFKGLKDEEKKEVYNYLIELDGVDSIDYDETENYNKDDYTLYVITVDNKSDSEVATNIYNKVIEKYNDYEIYTSGDIAERNKPVLESWIIGVAVGCALIILIIMCESYVEPFLFLITILMAVLLNKGTNILFSSVSNITQSISAILQLALSMDYSIMLMNRYSQEKSEEKDKVKAMKTALYHSFKSISSSSLTTIVGLIVLVFMSFTIGKDLGFVLAKGVLFSLISVFFVLPGLILIFDKWIEKTHKKTPKFNLSILGKISYKCRFIAIPIFILFFIASFLLKGNLGILYTSSELDDISKVFKENNQMAIVYKNEDEEKIANLLTEIEDESNVDEILAYSNTINDKLSYDELNEKLNSLGSDIEIDNYLSKILYYNYYNKNPNVSMTFSEFVKFIKSEVYNNPNFADELDETTKNDIDRLENFTTSKLINKNRTPEDIAQILDIDEEKVKDIFIYYSAKNNNLKISIGDFINFINNDVLTNKKYSSSINSSNLKKLNTLSKFISKKTINTKLEATEMANLFELDEDVISDLYKYYISVNKINIKMTLSEFSEFVLDSILTDPNYSKSFNEETIKNIKLLENFSDINNIKKQMNSKQLSVLFGINQDTISKVLLLKYSNIETNTKLSLSEFIKDVVDIKNNTKYLDNVDTTSLEQLYVFANNKNNINTTYMDKNHLSSIFDNISPNLVENIYKMAKLDDTNTMTPQQFVNLIIKQLTNNPDNKVLLNKLNLLKMIIDDSVSHNGTKYTAKQLSNILGIELNQTYQLYTLIDYKNGNTNNWTCSPYDFVNLILENSKNENISSNINKTTLSELNLLLNIMNSALNNTSYSYNELADFISIDSSDVKNIYTVYSYNISKMKITPKEFVSFVLKHINDSTLSGKISNETINNLELLQTVMGGVVNNKKYSNIELSNLLNIDKDKIELLYGLYDTTYGNQINHLSLNKFINFLINDVITNPDYSSQFDNEKKLKLNTVNGIMNSTINETKYTNNEMIGIISILSNNVNENTIELLYSYFGSVNDYNANWKLSIEEFVKYLNEDILTDKRFEDFIDKDMKNNIIDAKETINDAKKMLIGNSYSRVVINSKFASESEETFSFIQKIKDLLNKYAIDGYIIGDSPMAYEMSSTFNDELNFITILTMIAIYIVVALTFKSLLTPTILVFIIQCAVYTTMGILSFSGNAVYFISILIVQSILMGATIDYAILYTSYYIEHRKNMNIKEAIIASYNKSIHTILTSSSILIIVTLIVANFASAIASKICRTISEGTICSTILILLLLPSIIAFGDKFIVKKNKKVS